MKQYKTTKSLTAEQLKKIEEDKELRLFLEQSPDRIIKSKGSDQLLEAKFEKIELVGGDVILGKELHKIITSKVQEYTVRFKQEYYLESFRLNGWTIPKSGKIVHKPKIMGKYTALIIYGRYPKEVLPKLQGINKWSLEIGCRLYKHFQFFAPDGDGIEKLERFIDDSIELMKKCTTWTEFEQRHALQYGKPFQLSIFDSLL